MNIRRKFLAVGRAALAALSAARQQPQRLYIHGLARSLRQGVVLGISMFTCGVMAQTLPPGRYVITLADGGLALEAEASGMNSNDGKVHLWQNNGGGATQVWSVGSAGGGTYTIALLSTRKALDADGPTMHSDGGKVHLWEYNAGKTQKWQIQSAGNNTYTVILADGGKALDAAILSMHRNDGLVHLWSANEGKTQKWVFTPWTSEPQTNSFELTTAPTASAAELTEFSEVVNNQNGVGVLGGDNTRPFYFHANLPNESVYKYKKLIDTARLPDGGLEELSKAVNNHVVGAAILVLGDLLSAVDSIKDDIIGNGSTMKWIDTWYPVSENKVTVCGKVNRVEMCTQDYLHTRLTVDKDFNVEITPSQRFSPVLNNRWLTPAQQNKLVIEGEVRLNTFRSGDALTPRNPAPMRIAAGTDTCMYGPWMADILDIDARIPIPFTDDKIDIHKWVLNTNNEIHPVNQLWFRNGDEIDLLAFGDGSGYFDKVGRNEIEASGLNHPMRFYIAFQVPKPRVVTASAVLAVTDYDINGSNFQATSSPVRDVQPQTLQLTINNNVALRVNDNSLTRTEKSHAVFFDRIRVRPDGSYQGYIVVETIPIVNQGGSININVKIRRPTGPVNRIPSLDKVLDRK